MNKIQFAIEVIDRASKQLTAIGSRFATFARKITDVSNILRGVIVGTVVLALVNVADTMTLVENRIKLVTDSTEELAAVQEELFRVAQRTRSALSPTVELYSRVARSVDVLNLTQRKVIDLTETINKTIQISGATTQEAAAGVIQFAQGLASGALRGDELRSVLEQMPRLAQAIAKGMGITVGQLRELGTQGKLSAEAVIEAVMSQADVINEEFVKVAPTVGSAFQVLKNSMTNFVGQLSDTTGASDLLAGALQGVAGGVDAITRSIDNSEIARLERELEDVQTLIQRLTAIRLEQMEKGIRAMPGGFSPELAVTSKSMEELIELAIKLQEELDKIRARTETALDLSEIVVTVDDSRLNELLDKWEKQRRDKITRLADHFVSRFETAEEKIARELSEFDLVNKMFPDKFTDEQEKRIIEAIEAQRMEGLEFFDLNAVGRRGRRQLKNLADDFDYVAEAGRQAARSIQQAWAEFFFDPFEDGLRGLLKSFVNTVRRMVAELAASGLVQKLFGGEDSLGKKLISVFGRAAGGPGGPGQTVRVHDGELVTFGPSGGSVTSVAAQRSQSGVAGSPTFVTNIDARGADPSLIARMPSILEQRDRALMLKVKRYFETGSVPI